jgi:hypothetical protein
MPKAPDDDRLGRGYIHPVSPDRAAILLEPEYKGSGQDHDAGATTPETYKDAGSPIFDGRSLDEAGLPIGGSGEELHGVEQNLDAAHQASELHDDMLGAIDADRYFAETHDPDEQAARAKLNDQRDAIIDTTHIRTDDPDRGKKLAARDAALAAHYASAADERITGFLPPEPTPTSPPRPSTGFTVTRRRSRSNTRP